MRKREPPDRNRDYGHLPVPACWINNRFGIIPLGSGRDTGSMLRRSWISTTQIGTGTQRRKSRGQSIVELAFVTPLLLLMLVIAGDLGRAFTAYLTVGSAAGAGASYAIINEDFANNTAGIEAAAMEDAGSIWGGTPTVTVDNDAGNIDPTFNFRWVEVTVAYEFSPMLGIWPMPSSIPMERTVRMPVLGTGG